MAGLNKMGKPWKRCERCVLAETVRGLRKRKRKAPRKRLGELLPAEYRVYGKEAGIEMWKGDMGRAEAGVARLEREAPVEPVHRPKPCTRKRCSGVAVDGFKWCPSCREKHRNYQRRARSNPFRREWEQYLAAQRRNRPEAVERARERAYVRSVLRFRERNRQAEIERLEARAALDAVGRELMELARNP